LRRISSIREFSVSWAEICTVNRVTMFHSTAATRGIEKADPRSHTLIRLAFLLECAAATEGAADAE
jgi:hypothetical protein